MTSLLAGRPPAAVGGGRQLVSCGPQLAAAGERLNGGSSEAAGRLL